MFEFDLNCPVKFSWNGRFVSPNENWMHISRKLLDYELMIVVGGTLYIADENNKYEVHQGQYIIMPPTNKQYGYKPSECDFYWFHFNVRRGICKFENIGQIKSFYKLQVYINKLNENDIYNDPDLQNHIFAGLLLELKNQQKNMNLSTHELLCQKIKDYIEWNELQVLKVCEIAEKFGYNEKYISTLFKKETGISLKQYIINVKMTQAKSMLENSHLNISQIAMGLGFGDIHNFSHAFKKSVGVSPMEFKNKCK